MVGTGSNNDVAGLRHTGDDERSKLEHENLTRLSTLCWMSNGREAERRMHGSNRGDNTAGGDPDRVSRIRPSLKSTLDGTRETLKNLAVFNIAEDRDAEQFFEDMYRFDVRAAADHLSVAEVSDTYKQIIRLMRSERSCRIPSGESIHLAEEVMHQAADPATISQGKHDTCSVASIEARVYRKYPACAARLVADVALTGKYTDYFGRTVELDKDSLMPDREARQYPPGDWVRSFASQLFEVTAASLYWEKRDDGERPTSSTTIGYKQLPDYPRLTVNERDTGERLYYRGSGAEVMGGAGEYRWPVRSPYHGDLGAYPFVRSPDRQA